jgi:hypothetical protein
MEVQMSRTRIHLGFVVGTSILLIAAVAGVSRWASLHAAASGPDNAIKNAAVQNAISKVEAGEQIFRFDTFGDQAFWGDTLNLHKAIEGAALGGVGPGVSPKTALAVGLKVDVDALPKNLVQQIEKGRVNLNDPAVTVALLQLNAVVGVTGIFNSSGKLQSMGIQCALCHSTVDNSNPALCAGQITPNPGTGCIGHRLDGWPNRDLNVGAIVALAPNLSPLANLLGTDQATVRKVLHSWGPGKFDAELLLDGKAFNPEQVTDGTVTGTNVSGASLIPPAFGLAGVNLHTWIGWGSVPHWNAFVANLEMHGKGRFFDPRLNNAEQFPIAAANGFGDLPHINPDDDQITPKLAALQLYQLSLPAPKPTVPFNQDAAERGDALFSGKAGCNNCHVEPLWSEPGWNMHTASDVCIDSFQADRGPDHRYRTSPIGAMSTHFKGGFYHDGRFPDLNAVVEHYNKCMSLGLTDSEKSDLIQYLISLRF